MQRATCSKAAALWLELDRLRHALTQNTLEADLTCLSYPGHMDDYQDGKIKLSFAHKTSSVGQESRFRNRAALEFHKGAVTPRPAH